MDSGAVTFSVEMRFLYSVVGIWGPCGRDVVISI